MSYIQQVTPVEFTIQPGFVPNMRVPGTFFVNERLKELVFEELELSTQRGEHGGFLPAVKQIANVAALPGIVRRSIALPDVHSGALAMSATIPSNCLHRWCSGARGSSSGLDARHVLLPSFKTPYY